VLPSATHQDAAFEIRPLLYKLACQYSSSEDVRNRIVEKTIFVAIDRSDILFDREVDEVLHNLLHETAVEELKLTTDAPIVDTPDASDVLRDKRA
jgi:hypothetical protein